MPLEKENFSNPLEKEEAGIKNVESFEALCAAVRGIGRISGTQKDYAPEEIIKIIERVRHGHRPIEFVTRSYGIREAVERLLKNDQIYQKYTHGSKTKK